jgi:hypothetical protein
MRRLRSSTLALAASFLCAAQLASQATGDATGTAFLLLPIGARAVGLGQAVVADYAGSESVWWNPAAIAQTEKREAAIHHSQTVVATGDALTYMAPSRVGVLALSLDVLNFGDQQVTDEQGPVGVILPRNLVVAGTLAHSVGQRFNGGISYKIIQFRVDCSGQCANVATFAAKSNAVDAGFQYKLLGPAPMMLGIAVRNVGARLKVDQRSRPDPLPTRVELGIAYPITIIARYVSDIDVKLDAAVTADNKFDAAAARFGADFVWQHQVYLRAGYAANETNGAGAALGFGLVAGKLEFDIARSFGGLSSDAGQPPTYFSLRYLF